MRAVFMSAIIVAVLAVFVGAMGAFYWVAAFLGIVTEALFGEGRAYIGMAVANVHTLLLVVVMITASLLTVAERKWSSAMQNRIGPNRARIGVPGLNKLALGGIPHFIADGIKMLTKEDFIPGQASKFLFTLAPMLAFGPAFMLFAVVPMAPVIPASDIPGIAAMAQGWGVTAAFPVSLQIAPNLDIGVLYIFAMASLAVYGTALAGWASNNRFALLGGVRAASQMISYEIALGLSLVGAMMAFSTLRLEDMTAAQNVGLFGGALPAWGIFLQPFGFILFFAAAFAETKRTPFDAPEGEAEIIGYFVEYSGMRFGMFMISEFIEIVVLSGIVAAVFLGGFHLPVPPAWGWETSLQNSLGGFWTAAILGMVFLVKVVMLCWVQLLIRWTVTRIRYDQIQTLGWKILLPLALTNVIVTGVLILLDQTLELLALVGIAQLVLLLGITVLYPARKPASIRFADADPEATHVASGH